MQPAGFLSRSRLDSSHRAIARRLNRELREQPGEIEGDADRFCDSTQNKRAMRRGAPGGRCLERSQACARQVVHCTQVDHEVAISFRRGIANRHRDRIGRRETDTTGKRQNQHAVMPFRRDPEGPPKGVLFQGLATSV